MMSLREFDLSVISSKKESPKFERATIHQKRRDWARGSDGLPLGHPSCAYCLKGCPEGCRDELLGIPPLLDFVRRCGSLAAAEAMRELTVALREAEWFQKLVNQE
jgi:hypothetical protein